MGETRIMSNIEISNKVAAFGYAGSISHGTLRTRDLLDSFESVLIELSDNKQLKTEVSEMLAFGEDEIEYGDKACEAAWLLESVFDEMESLAPSGYYFGSTEGDASDYGYWLNYAEPEED